MKITINVTDRQRVQLLYIASSRKEGRVEAYSSTTDGNLDKDKNIIEGEIQRAIEWHIMENTP